MIDPRLGITDFQRCGDAGPRLGAGGRAVGVSDESRGSMKYERNLLGRLMSI